VWSGDVLRRAQALRLRCSANAIKTVDDLPTDKRARPFVHTIIDLAQLLDMTVAAEGVETEAQYGRLVVLGCDFCLGYFLTRPMTARGSAAS
jgi:EAL domain-containing protein (putative c-di-GMP-specific phosphodiesterase class I)